MTPDEIRAHLGNNASVLVQIANSGDGSPEIAWGDTFFYVFDRGGTPKKMPFTTIVIKDYPGFDYESDLNRGGLYRLNMELGKDEFQNQFGFSPTEFNDNRSQFDFTLLDQFFPHPVYGQYGWVSIINPEPNSADRVRALLDLSLERALRRVAAN